MFPSDDLWFSSDTNHMVIYHVFKCLTDGGGVAYGGLPFPGNGCSVPDFDFNYFIDLHQMLEMIDML